MKLKTILENIHVVNEVASKSKLSLLEDVDAKLTLLTVLIPDEPRPIDIVKQMLKQTGSAEDALAQVKEIIPWLKKLKVVSAQKLVILSSVQKMLMNMN